jgi:Domain of unknown function (DUF4375)
MDDFDYVLNVIEPWLDRYIAEGPTALGHRETVAVGIWLMDAEVKNGGFDQYYANSRGVLAQATVSALHEIGADDTASLLEAANKDVPYLPLPEDRDERYEMLNQISEYSRFGSLEQEYFEQREDRIALLANYLRRTAPSDA